MFKIVCIIILCIHSVNSQFLDPYGFYNRYNVPSPGFYKAAICNCESVQKLSSSAFIKYEEIPIGGFRFYANYTEITIRINLTNTNVFNMFTDHVNIIKYTLDGINWSNDYKGQFYICNIKGYILINIISTTKSMIRFYTLDAKNCSVTGNNDTIINEKIIGDTTLNYTFNSFGMGLFIISDTPGCNFNTYIVCDDTFSIGNKYNYSIGASFAQRRSTFTPYNIYLYIIPQNKQLECDIVIHLTSLIYIDFNTSPVLFYNNTQIINYLLINQTYDTNWNGVIPLDGGTSINSLNFNVRNLNNLQVYSIFKEYDFIDNLTYFQPLLVEYGDYIGSNVTINNNFNFTQNLIINMSNMDINISNIPVNITLQDSNIILYQDINIKGIDFQGNNTIIGNSSIFVNDVNFSGLLTLDLNTTFIRTESQTIMRYNNSNGVFTDIKVNNIDNCTKLVPKYTENQLSILFKVKYSCQDTISSGGIPDNILYYIVIPIVVILVILSIIIVILIVKVPSIRNRVFPHRDKLFYNRNKQNNDNNDTFKRVTSKDYTSSHKYTSGTKFADNK